MRRIIGKVGVILFVIVVCVMISNISKASGGLLLKNLKYDVSLNGDGSADVVETWRIAIEDTNTLFKTFEVDPSKYKEITNVKVEEVTKNGTVPFTKVNQYQYHVEKNRYYGLMYKGKFEIAWGAHAEDVTKMYKISYKVIDAVKNYQDCSEFYWQFISTASEIPARVVEGTIRLPKMVQNKEDLKVWAHGSLNGNIEILSNDTVKFEVEGLEENTMLEARVVTPNSIFANNQNRENTAKLSTILAQEQKWADEANATRERIAKRKQTIKMAFIIGLIVSNMIGFIVAIILIRKIKQYHRQLKQMPIRKPEENWDYYRDIPDENETPAGAGFLYYFKNTGLEYNLSKVISATMLDLCLKKMIEFEVTQEKKNEIKIILKEKNADYLPKDEKIIYNLLQKVPRKGTKTFTMKELEKYMSRNSTSVIATLNRIEKEVKKEQEQKENYKKASIEQSTQWISKAVGYIFLTILSLVCMYFIAIPAIIATIYSFKIASRYNQLTQKGVNEKAKWYALKKYMEEFSMIKDKTVPELVLWEKYLVYATAFGIAEKVLKQLKIVYPQIEQITYGTGYTYLYLMYSGNLNTSFINTLNTSVTRSYQGTMNYSSGSGSGGGFSSGGGFGGGGGRNGRKINILFSL